MIRQAIILCGGLGTRLGALTKAKPKPLLPVDGRPFLELLIGEVVRQGFDDILLLAGFCSDQVSEFVAQNGFLARLKANIRVVVEPEPAGTGGALQFAAPYLEPEFVMMNGDSLFDIPLRQLCLQLESQPKLAGIMALRKIERPDRYGLVELDDGIVTRFAERQSGLDHGLINGGIYALRRTRILSHISGPCSMEADVFPLLAAQREIGGFVADGFFLDIGVPDSFAQAHHLIPTLLRRPAIFFDRDGVLNVNYGYVASIDHFTWIDGAREAVALANAAGYLVFVVTNQAGIARGYYGEAEVIALFDYMQQQLAERGAHIDDFRYCPHHVDGVVERFRGPCNWRKPNPGMLVDLMDQWPIDRARSFLIGDNESDIAAANAAGISGHLFAGGSLARLVSTLINSD